MMEEQKVNIIGQMVNTEIEAKLGRLLVENAELRARNQVMSQYIQNIEAEKQKEGESKNGSNGDELRGKTEKAKKPKAEKHRRSPKTDDAPVLPKTKNA